LPANPPGFNIDVIIIDAKQGITKEFKVLLLVPRNLELIGMGMIKQVLQMEKSSMTFPFEVLAQIARSTYKNGRRT
jgi:hypothetical protein